MSEITDTELRELGVDGWLDIMRSCAKAADVSRCAGDLDTAARWAMLCSQSGAQAGKVVEIDFESDDAKCSFEVSQGARDTKPRLASLKVYFPYGANGADLAAYAKSIILEIEAVLEEKEEA